MNKAVFLDRDGVINESHSDRVRFVNKTEDMHILPGVARAIAKARRLGYKIFVVTNQGGMHYGYMSHEQLSEIHQEMKRQLLSEHTDAIIDDIVYCPHNPKGDCSCRKPKPGMLIELSKKHNIDCSQSWMVGDMESDIEAGNAAGCQSVQVGNDEIPDLLTVVNECIGHN